MTKGLDVEVSEVAVPNTNIVVDLFLFDMGGQSIFNQRQMAKRFWENCSYIICVFDVSSRKSLQSVKTWVASVRSASATLLDIPTILVANKIDLREVSFLLWETIQVQFLLPLKSHTCSHFFVIKEVDSIAEIDKDEGKKYADYHGFQYFECSTETCTNVAAPFQHIAKESAAQYQQESYA